MADDPTSAPRLGPQIFLAAAFIAFVVIGVVTVLIPALSAEPEEEAPGSVTVVEDETSPTAATSE